MEANASNMLEEMIKSTHQLDEILQRMCSAAPKLSVSKAESGGAQDSEEEFVDCIGVAIAAAKLTIRDYLQTVKTTFRSYAGGILEVPASVVDIETLQSSFNGVGGDLNVRFASCVRDTTFMFSPSPEFSVSYNRFISQLRRQIVACDHIVPVERADAAAELMVLLLEEQQRRLLGAISAYFPYQRESLHWVQSNRVCETVVQERQQDNQWGLLVQSIATSVLQARVNEHSEDSSSLSSEDSSLSSCTRCCVFLPKTNYLQASRRADTFQASIAIQFALNEGVSTAKDSDSDSGDQRRNSIKSPSSTQQLSTTTALPEILSVAVWGSHDENPISDDTRQGDQAMGNTFRKVEIATPFPRNRIVQAACSRFHTLFLNDMGLVFAFGHAMDGALGLGYKVTGYVEQPTLVDYFFDNLIVVQDISCGGDELVGAHSAAVTQDGGLFTWGVGIALGKGTLRSASTPQRINLTGEMASASSVSCGSGFCVALTREGHAFSWGKWSDGRLGLGRIPIIARTSRRYGGGAVRKQLQSFQLKPKRIQNVYPTLKAALASDGDSREALFAKVSCGDAHCIGLTKDGELATWGRGNNGQQGRGDASDALSPTTVFNSKGDKQWRDVAAGENWSMALSRDGQVWTWGACGSAVLGHGLNGSEKNALLAETILQRHQRLFSQGKKPSGPVPTFPCLKWMTPQMIPCFATSDIRISRISAGVQHAAAISDTGDLYMWGENYFSESEGSKQASLVLSSLPTLVNSGQTTANNQIFADIGTHSIEHVVCGGRQTIALTSGSFLGRSMDKLYRDSLKQDKGNETGADLVLVVSGQRILAHKLLLAQRSPVLRELILEEEEQQQNRRDQNQTDSRSPIEPMEILLPRLRVDVARALVEFIYTDNFTMELSKSGYYLVNDVQQAAKVYQVPSLVRLCRERQFSASPSSLLGNAAAFLGLEEIAEEDEDFSDNNSEDNSLEQKETLSEVTRTLNDDMKFALSDEVWADTALVAEGRSIPVHRCMLVARSEYFRAALAFQRSSTQTNDASHALAVVNVEDTFAGIVRVLRFIYYDQVVLPSLKTKDDKDENIDPEHENELDEAGDQLLEDLVAADKYGLERMKRLCEHAIRVTAENCLEVLAVAELVHAAHLKQVAMRFAQTHLANVISREEEFQRFQEDFPSLLEELYTSLRDASREEFLLREWHKEVGTSLTAQEEEQELQWGKKAAAATFPWVPLSLTIAFGTMYLSLMHAQEHEFAAVPATNLIAIAAIGGAILMGYL